jgi:hypothetical protein
MASVTHVATLKFHYDDACEVQVKQLSEFLSCHPELERVTCIGVKTGYTDRVYSQAANLNAAVVFTDKCWKKDLQPLIRVRRLYEIVKPIFNDGIVVFANTSVKDVFGCIERLANAEYCAFCNAENLYLMRWYQVGNALVVECCVDCESG